MSADTPSAVVLPAEGDLDVNAQTRIKKLEQREVVPGLERLSVSGVYPGLVYAATSTEWSPRNAATLEYVEVSVLTAATGDVLVEILRNGDVVASVTLPGGKTAAAAATDAEKFGSGDRLSMRITQAGGNPSTDACVNAWMEGSGSGAVVFPGAWDVPAAVMSYVQGQVWDMAGSFAPSLDTADLFGVLAGGMTQYLAPDSSISAEDAPLGFVVPRRGLYAISVGPFFIAETDSHNAASYADWEIDPLGVIDAHGEIVGSGVLAPSSDTNRVYEITGLVTQCQWLEIGDPVFMRLDPGDPIGVDPITGEMVFGGVRSSNPRLSIHWIRDFDITGPGGGGGDGGPVT